MVYLVYGGSASQRTRVASLSLALIFQIPGVYVAPTVSCIRTVCDWHYHEVEGFQTGRTEGEKCRLHHRPLRVFGDDTDRCPSYNVMSRTARGQRKHQSYRCFGRYLGVPN